MTLGGTSGMSLLEYHVLLALASAPLHGYAIKDVVADESGGTLTPRAGTLYRVIARLITVGYVSESSAAAAGDDAPHPGLARKYYALTSAGRAALAAEARRQKQAAATAEKRLGIVRGRP
jgi:DNA-binding PadR family transcriptional regulator